MLAGACAGVAHGAERDICENRTGQDLIRCIEASARGTPAPPARITTSPAPQAPTAIPNRSSATASAKAPAATAPSASVVPELPSFPPEDCTGRVEQDLRRCLAAGGRLQPSAAIVPPEPVAPPAAPASVQPESCNGKTGEALRLCIERSAKNPTKPANNTVPCTSYHAADQPLCLHRNSAIIECQNRKRYPDFDVCMRSHMTRAPEPKAADCRNASPRAKAHCESRNRVYQSCTGDKIGYFACLERHLGTDAMLTKR